MKKAIGALALVLVVFSTLFLSTDAFAGKAAKVAAGPQTQTVDVSSGVHASFNITNLNGATQVKIQLQRNIFEPYADVTGLTNITATGSYSRTAEEMQSQFGNFSGGLWKVVVLQGSGEDSDPMSITVQD